MSDEQRMEFFCTAQCKGLSDDALRETVIGLLKENRINHVLGCAETAVNLAGIWGADARDAWRAGMLHDITKALGEDDQRRLCQEYGLQPNPFLWENPKTLHQLTGAAVASRVFGENEAVCLAIRTHTTGSAGMNTLQKIIYIADYIEPNRDFDGVNDLRKLANTDLDKAMQMGLEMTLSLLTKQGRTVCPDSLAALQDLKKENVEC
mgnify:CR=1 FL=1